MIQEPSLTGVAIALLLPWCLGVALVARLLGPAGTRCKWLLAGHGYFIGMFAATLALRGFDALGLPFDFPALCALLAVLTLAAGWSASRLATRATAVHQRPALARWQWLVVGLILAWLALRYALMARELLLRPLFAWDAWMNWAPKAVTWYHLDTLAPFVEPRAWYAAGNEGAYTLGNWVASTYPEGVPLIQLWFMLGAGTWEHGLVYIGWLAAPLALGMALYGHLRRAGTGLLTAVVVAYLVFNMPFVNVHSVLAGYADIWLAGGFSLALFALREWRLTRHWQWAALFLAVTVFCAQLKNPGIVLAMILAACGLREWLRLPPRVEFAAFVGVLCFAALLIGLELQIPIPLLGTLGYSDGVLEAGRVGAYEIETHPEVARSFALSFFQSINWNLLFYYLPVLLLVQAWRRRWSFALPGSEILALTGAAAFLAFAFFFSERYEGALNFSTLNRAILYIVPGLIFSLAVAFTAARHDTSRGACATNGPSV